MTLTEAPDEDWETHLPQVEQRCGARHRPLDYVLRDQALYLEAHGDAAGGSLAAERVTLVSRSYALEPQPGAAASADCVVARCTARRRSAP